MLAKENPPPIASVENDTSGQQKQRIRTRKRSTPLFKRWELYAGGTLLGIAGGTLLAINAQGIESDIQNLPDGTEFSTAQTLEDRAQQRILFANISFGAAGALGLTALWMYLGASDSSENSNASLFIPTISSEEVAMTYVRPF